MPKTRPNWAARVALIPTGIRLKLLFAFVLMSVIPLAMLILLAAWFALPSVRDFYHLERWFPLIPRPPRPPGGSSACSS